ncbi:uncharacterized protein BT62DRAFT_705545 [Guyanagaster necrorhizus]|uniref:Uncharacterized protein n=1 Tax=Guyanagaster necrorhizus TaxID=856835 RepID=A0A9P7VW44_9AGAR|nr:uncharacterized protein BT62DRAFT_705545 [Guyanagaster necrorhizus MCA 3950]KAG7448423.1 hypothetical protein BT62DRAFT_705545 [Guyanagaster necrorhizus MCA 3950]
MPTCLFELIVQNIMSPVAVQLTTYSNAGSNDATYADSLISRKSYARDFSLRSRSGSSEEIMVASLKERNATVVSNKFMIKAKRSMSIRSAATTPTFLRLRRPSDVNRPPSPSLPSPVVDRLRRQRSDSTAHKFVKTAGVLLRFKSVPNPQGVGNDPSVLRATSAGSAPSKLPSTQTRPARSPTASHGRPQKVEQLSKPRRQKSFATSGDVEIQDEDEDPEEDEVAKESRLLVSRMNRRWILEECRCPYDKKQLGVCVM